MWRSFWLAGTVGCAAHGSEAAHDGSDGATARKRTDATCEIDEWADVIPLKEAKLIIEHNATDLDTGFQGFLDSDGWACMNVTGPDGPILSFRGQGSLAKLGLTELFFETVEPENADVPLEEILEVLPEGEYTFEGVAREAGEDLGVTRGTATLTHDIPAGPVLVSPAEGAVVRDCELLVDWEPVSETIDGDPVTIISYQLIVEKDEEPDPNMIGKRGLSMYLPATTTEITLPEGFLEARTAYDWEVLAIEEGGNQTLSSGSFRTGALHHH